MKILITNDDGVQSPGILNLRDILAARHDVWIMAPEGDRSGYSHSITLREPVKILPCGERTYSCSGTPVDCIVYGHGGYLEQDFDLILSGINIGPNLGTDIIYSGTAAAARQGALKGIPSIALSLNQFIPPFDFASVSNFLLERLEYLVSIWEEGCFLNMNFPPQINEDTGLIWSVPAQRIYKDEVLQFQAPREKGTWCFLKGNLIDSEAEKGSDVETVESGNVSLSAIALAPSVYTNACKTAEETVC